MNAHVVIITGKRIICVDEHSPRKEKPSQKLFGGIDKLLPAGVRRATQTQADHADGLHDAAVEADGQLRGTGNIDAAKNYQPESQGEDIENGGAGFASKTIGADQNSVYKHWNVFFKDIYRVSFEIVDRETNKVISYHDLEQRVDQSNNRDGARAAGGNFGNEGQQAADCQLKVYFVLKIYYQTKEESGSS